MISLVTYVMISRYVMCDASSLCYDIFRYVMIFLGYDHEHSLWIIPILRLSTYGCPIAARDGHDFPRLIDKRIPGVAAVIDDVVEGFENSARQPVLPHELPGCRVRAARGFPPPARRRFSERFIGRVILLISLGRRDGKRSERKIRRNTHEPVARGIFAPMDVVADYDARTAVERELVPCFASLSVPVDIGLASFAGRRL